APAASLPGLTRQSMRQLRMDHRVKPGGDEAESSLRGASATKQSRGRLHGALDGCAEPVVRPRDKHRPRDAQYAEESRPQFRLRPAARVPSRYGTGGNGGKSGEPSSNTFASEIKLNGYGGWNAAFMP